MSDTRYFVDCRVGCVAVRDRTQTDVGQPCLNSNTSGVVKFWKGTRKIETCPTCGHVAQGGWEVSEADIAEANALCAKLNKEKGGGG